MNQMIEWLIVSGIVLGAFSVVFYYAEDTLSDVMLSNHDKMELQKRQAGEQLTLIDVMDDPLRIDVMNIGLDDITIKKLYVGNIADDNYFISDRFDNVVSSISTFEIVTITPSVSGGMVKIITQNNKIFSFE